MGTGQGVYVAVVLVLAAGGYAKVREPYPFVAAARQLGLSINDATARVIGGFEVALAGVALVIGGREIAAAVMVLYLVFAIVVVQSIRAGTPSCGCFGAASSPPSAAHVAINVGSAAVAYIASAGGGHSFLDFARASGGQTPLQVALIVILAALLIGLNTAGGELISAMRAPGRRAAS